MLKEKSYAKVVAGLGTAEWDQKIGGFLHSGLALRLLDSNFEYLISL
jgi:hypothetical protein